MKEAEEYKKNLKEKIKILREEFKKIKEKN